MLSKDKIETLIQPILQANQITIHQVNIITSPTKTLEICISKADGSMDLDTCGIVSEQISNVLDKQQDDDESYMLDVCSFGCERELFGDEDIANNVNEYIHVDLKNPINDLSSLEGTLISFVDDLLTVEYFVKGVKRKAQIAKDNISFIRLAVKL